MHTTTTREEDELFSQFSRTKKLSLSLSLSLSFEFCALLLLLLLLLLFLSFFLSYVALHSYEYKGRSFVFFSLFFLRVCDSFRVLV